MEQGDNLMVAGKQIIALILAVCAVTARVHADMMPASFATPGYRLSDAYDQTDVRIAGVARPWDVAGIARSEAGPITFLPQADSGAISAAEIQARRVLTDDQGSLDLCLYALFGLGLCRSVPLIRKLSFGCMPDWYHHGGPFQIGHSHAIGPDCLHCAVACFVQPEGAREDLVLHCYRGSIAALLRKSLFTPNVLASRGPPLTS
jgi:hypothetical protein